MGCDGGSIPRRDEMVKLKKKAQKAEKDIELAAKWRHCAISAEKLSQPIVACELGRLYNKEAVLMALLEKDSIPEVASHIRSLKDVFVLELTPNPSYKPSEKHTDTQSAEYICPVSGLEMSGHHRFCFIRSCGCVLSEKALKEVPSETCHKCTKPFSKDDVIILNGSEEDVQKLATAMEEKREQAKLNKLKRKRKATTQEVETSSSDGSCSSSTIQPNEAAEKPGPSSLPILPDPTSVPIIPDPVKKPKLTAGSKKVTTSSGASGSNKLKTDVKSRDAYRSLFTSSTPARPKELTSNWVTFFPYH